MSSSTRSLARRSITALGAARGVLAAVIALCASACRSPSRTLNCEDLTALGPEEGVVFGSVAIAVAEDDGESSFWAGDGYEAGDAEYRIEAQIPRTGELVPPATYTLEVRAGGETFFAGKLPTVKGGETRYALGEIRQLRRPYPVARLSVPFVVRPGQVTYVGRLVVELPVRIAGPHSSSFTLRVEDDGDSAMRELANRHPLLADRVALGPMWGVDEWRRTGNFSVDTVPPSAVPR